MIGEGWRWGNLALALLLELGALIALGYWGLRTSNSPVFKLALALGAPILAAVAWGLFAAPAAAVNSPYARAVTKIVVFGAATLGLFASGQRVLAVVFAVLVLANSLIVARQPAT